MRKLSASAVSLFLRSPKAYYWHYLHGGTGLEPIEKSVVYFDHDKDFGILWAKAVSTFYENRSFENNLTWCAEQWSQSWVPDKEKDKLGRAFFSLLEQYYQQFSPDDGVRSAGSEVWLENETFIGRLDGLSKEGVVHEVKTTSRCPQLAEQLWKVENSIQIKLYCVLAKANGVQIEFAYKDPPNAIYRAPVKRVTEEDRRRWEGELDSIADAIVGMSRSQCDLPCHPDGCCITSRRGAFMCPYQALCEGLLGAEAMFKQREIVHAE